jgi:uncharacterized protein DUF6600
MSFPRVTRVLALMAVVCLGAIGPARAQEPAPPPAHISFVEGVVTIEHEGEAEPAVVNMPVVEGDRLRTVNGRVQVMFPDGSAIDVDAYSEIEFVSAVRVRVLSGTIEHRAAEPIDPRSASSQYLPPDLQPYSNTFDRNGSWQYDAQYGSVWYPTVAADWQPYYNGYWSSQPLYGWTWIGYDRWAWPTHHYGRWGYVRDRWFWIPGRTWGSAWVSWGAAPGYVGWCPLGFDNRPIFSLTFRNSRARWTMIPRDSFGARGYSVRRLAVEPRRFADDLPIIQQATAPVPSHGVTRAAAAGFSRARDSQSTPAFRSRPTDSAPIGVAVPRYQGRGAPSQGPIQAPAAVAPFAPSESRVPNPESRPRPRYERQDAPRDQYAPRYGPRYEAPSGSEPARAVPRTEAPRTEAPRTEAPRTAPRGDAPRVQPSTRPEAPPRSEAPRAQPRADSQPRGESAPRGGDSRGSAPNTGPRGSGGPHASNPHGNAGNGGTAVRRPR